MVELVFALLLLQDHKIVEHRYHESLSKCRGVVPQVDEVETMPTGSLWDELKDDYIKANPDSKSMDNNNSTLKMPPEGYILPLPKPKDD